MANDKDGGTAFPTTMPLEHWGDPNRGMSLRDYFAGQAIAGILYAPSIGKGVGCNLDLSLAAQSAYDLADAMLKARSK